MWTGSCVLLQEEIDLNRRDNREGQRQPKQTPSKPNDFRLHCQIFFGGFLCLFTQHYEQRREPGRDTRDCLLAGAMWVKGFVMDICEQMPRRFLHVTLRLLFSSFPSRHISVHSHRMSPALSTLASYGMPRAAPSDIVLHCPFSLSHDSEA